MCFCRPHKSHQIRIIIAHVSRWGHLLTVLMAPLWYRITLFCWTRFICNLSWSSWVSIAIILRMSAGTNTNAGMFVKNGQCTICNCTWGHFHTCSVLTGQRLATQLHKHSYKNWANIVLHFLLTWGLSHATAYFTTDPNVRFSLISAQKTWLQHMVWFICNMSGLTLLKKSG